MSFSLIPASQVIPGHIDPVDGAFVCDVPCDNGDLCGERIVNKGNTIRSHKHRGPKHPLDYKAETRKIPKQESRFYKKSEARTISCDHCAEAVECKTAHALIAHYRKYPETHDNLKTEAEIFPLYPQLQLGKF